MLRSGVSHPGPSTIEEENMNRVNRATVASVAALACTVAAVASAGATSSAALPRGGKVVARLSIPQGTVGSRWAREQSGR